MWKLIDFKWQEVSGMWLVNTQVDENIESMVHNADGLQLWCGMCQRALSFYVPPMVTIVGLRNHPIILDFSVEKQLRVTKIHWFNISIWTFGLDSRSHGTQWHSIFLLQFQLKYSGNTPTWAFCSGWSNRQLNWFRSFISSLALFILCWSLSLSLCSVFFFNLSSRQTRRECQNTMSLDYTCRQGGNPQMAGS